jgi:predicted nucleic acid-binding Zn ribbon protein
VRRSAPRPLATALSRVAAGLAPATTLASVQRCWREVVGEALAAETEPVSERDGTVTVACRSAVWAQELQLLAPDLIERLNGVLLDRGGGPPLRGLRFRVGRPRAEL